MKDKKYIFVGNRSNVLKEMIRLGLRIEMVFVVEKSYLHMEIDSLKLPFHIIGDKEHLISEIDTCDFDILVSNGCPYILPITKLNRNARIFLNVHPSPLPDLKGKNPINAAILFNRPAGATCHLMDDEIDTGSIIDKIAFDVTPDIDLGLLYQMCFELEGDVFVNAFHHSFTPLPNQENSGDGLYFSRQNADFVIDFAKTNEEIVRQIRAFGIPSQGAYFMYQGHKFVVLDAEEMCNERLLSRTERYRQSEVVFKYDNNLLLRSGRGYIKLKNVVGNLNLINRGAII